MGGTHSHIHTQVPGCSSVTSHYGALHLYTTEKATERNHVHYVLFFRLEKPQQANFNQSTGEVELRVDSFIKITKNGQIRQISILHKNGINMAY